MIKPPPPTPCTTLPPINMPIETARPQSSEPTKKTTLAKRMTDLRPQMSLSLPHSGTEAAQASR
jgi:hypothetical protein